MNKPIRHGDLCLQKIDALPEGVTASDTAIMMEGSHGNPHKVKNGIAYFKNVDQYIFGYLVAKKGCVLLHVDHGDRQNGSVKEADLPEGIYELRKQFEQTHEGLKPVVD
ncbi:hypothetical protein M0R01_05020 [bacterium]|jgi:hypothetical protein|nr:hypothetical protein [bacterium]